ncbi:hypothetical protein OE88DRAFT_322324 [Heliocybe sulcata]|uniref:F-box domain-containing protein n=1 Tax=Heliocybe sulcata TaxID=5364 RepID=A0A5C3MYX9_9AGAM|nr:hypothetical protein OE88DRAFT_322324 [Heliocybe sulcata]
MQSSALTSQADLPVELIERIVQLAVVDGTGRTATALRLTNRYLSKVAEPYRFYCMAVEGPERIERLATAIRNASPRARNNCCHLLLSDVSKDTRIELEGREIPQHWYEVYFSRNEEANLVMCGLLELLNRTLETLVLAIYDGCSDLHKSVFHGKTLPELRRLSVHTRTGTFNRYHDKISLPKLSSMRLSTALYFSEMYPQSLPFLRAVDAPALTSLSFLYLRPVDALALAQRVLDVDPLRRTKSVREPRHLPNFQAVTRLVVQVAQAPTQCILSQAGQERHLEGLRWIADHLANQARRLELIESGPPVPFRVLKEWATGQD